jgi:hypothetical protein
MPQVGFEPTTPVFDRASSAIVGDRSGRTVYGMNRLRPLEH